MQHTRHNRRTWPWAKALFSSLLASALLVTAVVPAAGAAEAGQSLTKETAAAFADAFFASDEIKPSLAGATLVIVKDGETILQKGYGLSDKEAGEGVDPEETVFRLASISKTFTAVAIMQLVEQGKIDLNENFLTYTGPLPLDNPFGKPVTVEHLLTHMTGFRIQDPQPDDIHNDLEKFVSIEEYVTEHLPPVVREPGTSYMYDNFAFGLLGLIVEKVSGEDFEAYMQKHVFAPLAMDKSGFLLEGELKEDLAVAYDAAGEPIELYTVTPTVMPEGGMLSTGDDMANFMKAFLNGGALGQGRILSDTSVAEMEKYRSAIHPLLPNTAYGFESGIQLPGAGSNPAVVTKAGDLIGFSSYMFFIPEQNTGVYIAYNQSSILREYFYPSFIANFFPQYAAPASLEPASALAGANEQYEGLYSDLRLRSLVTAVVYGEDGGLTISDAILGGRPLIQVDDNLFTDEITGKFTAFTVAGDGSVYMREPYLNPYGYAKQGVKAAGFADVGDDHPYAGSIMALQSLGYYPNDPAISFQPESGITRSQYVRLLLEASGVRGSEPGNEPAFADIAGHPDGAFIQQAAQLGMVLGASDSEFKPDRIVTRQEAAVMIWRALQPQYPDELFADVELAGNTDEWAVPAVKLMVAFGLYGPRAEVREDGAVDFRSRQPLTRQENAVIVFKLLTTPMDIIVANMAEDGQ